MVQHGWVLALSAVTGALAFAALGRRVRRTVQLGQHTDTDRQAALAVGDAVPLATFAPDVPGALRRGWLGYKVIAESQPISVSGRLIQPGRWGRYRLGEDIRVGDRAFAIYRVDGVRPAASAADFSLVSRGAGWASGGLR